MTPHLDVARALKPMFTTTDGIEWMRAIGFGSENVVVCCSEDDLFVDVIARVQVGPPPGIVAFLSRGDLRVLVIETLCCETEAAQPVDVNVTVGMLFDAALATGEKKFRVDEWERDQRAYVPRSDLVHA